jgi:lipid-A-disaccharide synthase
VERLRERFQAIELRIPVASTLSLDAVSAAFADQRITILPGDSRSVLRWADLALVASGTATLETALIGTPFLLYYRISRSSAWIYHHLARYRGFIGMPNLLHGREVAREYFQEKASADNLIAEASRLIEDASYRQAMASALVECRRLLGQPGASRRAAAQVMEVLEARGKDWALLEGMPSPT